MTATRDQGRSVAEVARDLSLNLQPDARAKWWSFNVLGVPVYCYNFAWRRQAIAHHDLHHVVTGYPCTMIGEMQVAVWEFAAGRFPNVFANLFCLPLVAFGLVCAPRRSWSAYRLGMRCRTLFTTPLTKTILAMPVADLRKQVAAARRPRPVWRDLLGYANLCALSALLLILPALMLIVGLDAIRANG